MFKKLFTLYAVTILISACGAEAANSPIQFDVAEDHTRFVFAPAPVSDTGMPAHGNPFVTQGYIYPAGTLQDGTAGVLADGSPAFPEKVLGTWTCDGWFVGDGGDTVSGVWLVSRQIYDFNNGNVLISQGTELADIGVPNKRPITGGSGYYANIDATVEQTLLGFTDFMGVNTTFVIIDNDIYAGEQPNAEVL